jgi:hypothetical protein
MSVNLPYCIDIYHGDPVVGDQDQGFAQVKAQGIFCLDHKLTQGGARNDNMCAFRRGKWMDDTLIAVTDVDGTVLQLKPKFGFYHFNGTGTAAAEAAQFIAAAKPLWQPGDDITLDWEGIGGSGYQRGADWADDWCMAVEDAFGISVKVYGGNVPREQFQKKWPSSLIDRFATRRFWFCQYGAYNRSELPLPWMKSGPYQWQDDGDSLGPGRHTVPGITGYCDNSTVVGPMTAAKLAAEWGGGKVAA